MKIDSVKLVEVGARDGLQNEAKHLSSAVRIEFINLLSAAGLPVIEAGSFVSAERIPQMADSADVLQGIQRKPGVAYPVLVPNARGMQAAIMAGATEVAVLTSPSETFCQRNTHCSVKESVQRIAAIMPVARSHGIHVRGYLSCVAGCPYEGNIAATAVAALAETLVELGCAEVSLGDTIGIGTVDVITTLLKTVLKTIPANKLAVHFHATYGQALVNIYVALQHGIRIIDSSVAGLGGCPYAKGASGNVATEDVIYLLHGMGMTTGVDLQKLMVAADFILQHVGKQSQSRVGLALLAKQKQEI